MSINPNDKDVSFDGQFPRVPFREMVDVDLRLEGIVRHNLSFSSA
jgi:hypothetical protein